MALTVTEAMAVNNLLAWLLGPERGEKRPSDLDAENAAALLAEHADKTLHAGIDAVRVRARWAQATPKRRPPK